MTIRGPKRKGLSLLEVLVALSIFIGSFVAIAALLDRAGDQAVDIELETEAALLAQSKLAEVATGIVPLQSGAGTFDEDSVWQWSVAADTESIPNLYRVTVTVFRERSNARRTEVMLTQLMLDPNFKGGPGGPPLEAVPVEEMAAPATPAATK